MSSFAALLEERMLRTFLLPALLAVLVLLPVAGAPFPGLAACCLNEAEAQDLASSTAAADLQSIRTKLEKEERRIVDLKRKQAEFKKSEQQLTEQLEKAAAKRESLHQGLSKLVAESERLSEAVGSVHQTLSGRQERFTKRVVAVYKATRNGVSLNYLFRSGSANEVLHRYRYLSAVSQSDRDYAEVLQKLANSIERDQARINSIQNERQAAVTQLKLLETELTQKLEAKAQLRKEEEQRLVQQEKIVAKLRNSATRLEQVLANIMGGERVDPPPEPAQEPTTQEPLPTELAKADETKADLPEEVSSREIEKPLEAPGTSGGIGSPGVIMAPYTGGGLESLRGQLVFPVAGNLIQNYGKQKHDEFSDVLFIKGLEVNAPVGARVLSVAAGKVVLSQVLPGYGNVVIVDHGQRYYSLYGRLASSLKSLGSAVDKGEPLAVLGEVDYKGRNFYFELRVKGKAVNPAQYLKSVPQASG